MKKRSICWLIICVMIFSAAFSPAVFAGDVQAENDEIMVDSSGDAADSWAQAAESAEASAAASAEGAAEAAEGADATGENDGDSSDSSGDSAAAMREAGFGDILDFDWAGYFREMGEKTANGEKISLKDALPDAYIQMIDMVINSPNNMSREEGVTVEFGCEGNELFVRNRLSADLDEKAVREIVENSKNNYESDETGLNMKETLEQLAAGFSIDINDLSVAVQVIGSDDEVLYEKQYRYEDVKDLQPAPAEEAAEDTAGID